MPLALELRPTSSQHSEDGADHLPHVVGLSWPHITQRGALSTLVSLPLKKRSTRIATQNMSTRTNPPLKKPTSDLIDRLAAIVGSANALTKAEDQRAYLAEWRDRYVGVTPLVLRPGSVEEVSEILKVANAARVGLVPQGGNTGLVGGQIPHESGDEVVLSLSRMNVIRDVDAAGQWLTAEAGVTLAAIQQKAEDCGRLFPLSLASEGSCQIGGNLATNAGGVSVLAYGNARSLVLGLEAVLADGRIWHGLKTLNKDNTGYDLKDLIIGSEGTLAVITAATVKLFPMPAERATALVAVADLEQALQLFRDMQAGAGSSLTAFEFMPHLALQFVTRHVEGTKNPFMATYDWYALVELSGSAADNEISPRLESLLGNAAEAGIILDAIIAASGKQAMDLWRLREEISDAQKPEGGSIKHDISVPISRIPEFIERANIIVEDLCPGARPCPFGHFGDGNIHYNISQPATADKAEFLAKWEVMNHAVHQLVSDMGGSISAEHGIGRMKREELAHFKSQVELDLMRAIKRSFDPNGILNPGKVL